MRLCIVSTWTGGRDATGSAVITAAAVMLGGTLLTTRPLPAAEPGSTTATSAAGPVTPVAAPAPVADAFERVGKLEDVLRVGLRDRKLDVALTLPKPAAERLAAGRPTPFRIGASDEDWLVEPAPQVQPQQPAGDAPAGLDPHQPQPAVGNAPPADAVNAAPAAAVNAPPVNAPPAAPGAADPANGGAAPAAPRAADSVDLGAAPAGAAGVPDVSPRPPAFLVTCEERENDRWSPLQVTSVSRTGGEADAVVTITGAGRAGTTSVAVTFVQDARTGTARFLVQRQRRMRARPLAGAQSSDLVQLFNDHQPETRLYLVPLLAELGRGDLLRPRPGDVYRAFPSIPPDPKVSRQVRDLLPALDSTESTERDAAVAKVEALGAPALLAVARLDPSELTPEQSSRLGALLARHSTWTDPAAAARDPDFLVDCLEDDDPAVRAAALDALRPLARREVRFDPAAAPEQRARAAASIREALRTPAPEPAAAE